MPLYDKRIQPFYKFWDTFFSIIRITSQTKFHKTPPMLHKHEKCLILGTGPSLIDTLENNRDRLNNYDLIALNHFAKSPEYVKYHPEKYVLCDPAFWFDESYKEHFQKVDHTYRSMAEVTKWPLELYLPYQAKKCNKIGEYLKHNPNISIIFYNKTKYEGYGQNFIYKKQWGMPRAQNILNAALTLAIYSNYQRIYLAGADNDWIKNVWVDKENKVRINDTHFYDYKEMTQYAREFGMSIDETMLCFYFAFSTYYKINEFAQKNGVKISNTNPLSYIDVFPKHPVL